MRVDVGIIREGPQVVRLLCLILILFLTSAVSGLMQVDVGIIRDGPQVVRLFYHETMRVFHDRLINFEDKRYFHEILSEMAQKYFNEV